MGRIADSIHDLAVGQRVRCYGDGDGREEVGVITKLEPRLPEGGHVHIRSEGETRQLPIQRYFDGFSGNRKWEILEPVEPKVGDTLRVADVREDVITAVHRSDVDGTLRVKLKDSQFTIALVENPYGPFQVRTWEVTQAAPVPFQAGDFSSRNAGGEVVVRQADGKWLGNGGRDTGLRDSDIVTSCHDVVRSGKRVNN